MGALALISLHMMLIRKRKSVQIYISYNEIKDLCKIKRSCFENTEIIYKKKYLIFY